MQNEFNPLLSGKNITLTLGKKMTGGSILDVEGSELTS
jgi:hypothetical protein